MIPANWTNDLCATELARRGLRDFHLAYQRSVLQDQLATDFSAVRDTYNTDFPAPYVVSYCGDGTTDTEFGEECDDGNTVNGDGCSEFCALEEP